MIRPHRLTFTARLPRLVPDARTAGAMIIALCGGCAGTITVDQPEHGKPVRMTRAEFRQYADDVFRHQNRVQSRAMMMWAGAGADSGAWQQLQDAEAEMMKACRSLNRLAAARASGKRRGGVALRGLPAEVVECERQSRRLEALLETRAAGE